MIFKSTSRTNGYPGFKERSGEEIDIVFMVEQGENGLESIFRVRFNDGVETDAFSGEIVYGVS